MATFFQTPGSGQLSEEEKQFKGIDYKKLEQLIKETSQNLALDYH